MTEIDSRAIDTPAGQYRVTWHYDEDAEQPYDDGFCLYLTGRDRSIDIDTTKGALPDLVESAILTSVKYREDSWEWELRSGAAIVRYMTLKGFKGVTLVDESYRPDVPSSDRRERVYGVAWDVGGSTDNDVCLNNVKVDLEEWRAWADGDTFGWVVTDPSGNEIDDGSVWGYYGFSREREYTLGEARDRAEYDANQRIEQASRVGAGIVGLV